MPAGVTWGRYLRFTAAAMLSMFAGSQTVHLLFRPLDDMDEWIEKERKKIALEKSKS